MKKLLIVLAGMFILNSAWADTFKVEVNDRSASDVFKRWSAKVNKKAIWDATMVDPETKRVLSVDFDILSAERINKELTNKNDFKTSVIDLADYFTNHYKSVYFQVCYYTDGPIALWIHSSHILKCEEVYEATGEKPIDKQ